MSVSVEDRERIRKLKEEKDAIILAHYYVSDDVQEIADYIGDSYGLAKKAVAAPQKTILFAGVNFMCESAKILNPDKTVLIPALTADCPMAHMVLPEDIQAMREQYDDLAVVCYINSTAEIKGYSDVIVTSSNAERVVSQLPNKNIYFIPDKNLGRYIAKKCPDKNFILNEGWCHVHSSITRENVARAKELHPGIKVLAHPECTEDVLELADYIGSTSGIIQFATECDDQEFLICTELGVLYDLRRKNPNKKFYSVAVKQFCPNMKKITLERVIRALEDMGPTMEISDEERERAYKPLARMLEMAK